MLKRDRTRAWLGTALVFLITVLGISACGGSGTNDRAYEERAEREARESVRLERRLEHLRKRLRGAKQQAYRESAPEQRRSSAITNGGVDSIVAEFGRLERSLPGRAGLAMGAPGSRLIVSAGTLDVGPAWSTSKVPIALRILRESGGPSGLSQSQAGEIRRALTASNNEAALSLFADLERRHGGVAGAAAAVEEVLAEAGDFATRVSTQGRDGFTRFGQTMWRLASQVQFMNRLASLCIGSRESSEYVFALMGEVTSDTWGLGSAGLPARWKGGWGPEADGRYLARQMGVLYVRDKQATVALAALPDDGSFATSQTMATSVARFAARLAPEIARQPSGC